MLLLVDPALNPIVRRTKSNLHQFHTLLHWTYTNLHYLPSAFESILHLLYVPGLTWSAVGIVFFVFVFSISSFICGLYNLHILYNHCCYHTCISDYRSNHTWHWVLIFHLSTPHKLAASPDFDNMTLQCFFQLSEQHKKIRLNVRARTDRMKILTQKYN